MASNVTYTATVILVATAAEGAAETIRITTFNASMNRSSEGALLHDLQSGDDLQVRGVAETLQRIGANVILLNEFDYDPAALGFSRKLTSPGPRTCPARARIAGRLR